MYKAVLHDHLDGGLRPETAKELAVEMNYEPLVKVDDIVTFFDRSDCTSLDEYLEAFVHTTALMNTFDNLERIAFEAAEDMHNNGITHYECRYAPLYSVNKIMTIENVIDAINSGFKQAYNIYGIKSGLILCGMRNNLKNVEEVAEIAINFKNKIIGFDIAGPELNYKPSLFKNSFKKLIESKINITIHAGEGDGVNSIQDAINNGAMRIGHGVRIIEDINLSNKTMGKTASYILEKQIPLEICITSNIHTNMYKNFEEHPVTDLIDLGFNVSLNTDNRLMSNTTVKKEIEIAKNLGIVNIDDIFSKSASYSFLN